MRKFVIGKVNIEGYHNYPNAPEEVNFLSYNHRHTFEITVSFLVEDLNREIEIFLLRKDFTKWIFERYGNEKDSTTCQFKNRSCEMIANEIINFYKYNECKPSIVEVWEENTGGSKIEL